MPNNHSKNGTILYACRGARTAVRIGRLEHVERDHGRAGVQTPDTLVRETLHERLAEGEETGDGPLGPSASSMTSITSIPSGNVAFSRSRTCAAAWREVSAKLRYSASLVARLALNL